MGLWISCFRYYVHVRKRPNLPKLCLEVTVTLGINDSLTCNFVRLNFRPNLPKLC